MRCAIYRRVSTDMQAEEGFSLEAQRTRLHAYAESQVWTIVEDYCDEGFSAKNTDRPQMQRLINDIKNKKFDLILVYRLDRFVRSVLDLHELLQLMDKHDVKFKSATEVFDTTSATGRLFITMIATLAQWERETIAERVHLGMMKKVEQGERNGAPAPYGYDLVDRNLIKNNVEAKWVQYIYNRYGSVGTQTIAKELNNKGVRTKKGEVWSDFSVRYVLRNPIYTGYVRWNYESVSTGNRKRTGDEVLTKLAQEDFEPLIDKELFDVVQSTLESRKNQAFRSDNFYPFSGIAKCEKCGYPLTGSTRMINNGKKEYRFYKCRGRINFGVCDVPVIGEDVIEDAFLKILGLASSDIEIDNEDAPTMNEDEIKKQLANLKRKKERAEELYLDGDITKDRYNEIIKEVKNDESDLHISLSSTNKIISMEEVKEILNNIKSEWSTFSYEIKKQAVNRLFKSITIRLVEKSKPPIKKAVIAITDYEFI